MPGLWYEQFEPGTSVRHATTIPVRQEDNEAFCRMTLNTQPLHLDADAARAQGFKDALVNGLYTFAASVGISVPDLTEGTLIANLGYDEVRHPAPVYPGDELQVTSTVVDKRESSKGGRGIVTLRHDVHNQDDVLVCSYTRSALVRMQPS